MRAAAAVSDFDDLRREMALHHCKWDAQVGDTSALAPFPIVLTRAEWRELSALAESLSREMFDGEARVVADPNARAALGTPAPISRLLPRLAEDPTPSLGRIVRFDFHPTEHGWRLSEANSDVPGGFTEASSFSARMAERAGGAVTGDPTRAWLDLVARRARRVALLVAPGWLEDAQVVSYLARGLRDRDVDARVVTPGQLRWHAGVAHANGRVDAIVRFHQVEWLADLPVDLGWHHFLVGGETRVGNPGIAVVSESKRFPIACAIAGVELPGWRLALPETREPLAVPFWDGDAWILKAAYGNTGEAVAMRPLMTRRAWAGVALCVALRPRRFAAQRRFTSRAIETPDGPRHVCVGVYTVDGVTAGAYARISPRPLIDFAAVDAAVLVDDR